MDRGSVKPVPSVADAAVAPPADAAMAVEVDATPAATGKPPTDAEAIDLAIAWMKAVRAKDHAAAMKLVTFPASVEPQTDNTIANRCWELQTAAEAKEYERLLTCFTAPTDGDPKAALLFVEKAIEKKLIKVEPFGEANPPEAWRETPGGVVVRATIVTGGMYDVHGLFYVVPTADGPRIRDASFAFDATE